MILCMGHDERLSNPQAEATRNLNSNAHNLYVLHRIAGVERNVGRLGGLPRLVLLQQYARISCEQADDGAGPQKKRQMDLRFVLQAVPVTQSAFVIFFHGFFSLGVAVSFFSASASVLSSDFAFLAFFLAFSFLGDDFFSAIPLHIISCKQRAQIQWH